MKPGSLRGQLALWLLVAITASLVINWIADWQAAYSSARDAQDRLLIGAARVIGRAAHWEDGVLQVVVPPAALELFHQENNQDAVFYRISERNGDLLAGYIDIAPVDAPQPDEARFMEGTVRGRLVRLVAYSQVVPNGRQFTNLVVVVAQTVSGRARVVRLELARSVSQEAVILLLTAGLIWLVLKRALEPVHRLRRTLENRQAEATEPLYAEQLPSELIPLIGSMNQFIERLNAQQTIQARFLADAAHQLRTPLAILQTQIDYALRSSDPTQRDHALLAAHSSVAHGARVVQQLLSLTRLENTGARAPSQDSQLSVIIQEVLEQYAATATARGIDLGCELPTTHLSITVSATLLHELLVNLVDNALRYSGEGGCVTVRMLDMSGEVVISVIDDGPGIPADLRGRVFERFFRIDNSRQDGCGLGLAIVARIALEIGAEISIADPSEGSGLVVSVRIPRIYSTPDCF